MGVRVAVRVGGTVHGVRGGEGEHAVGWNGARKEEGRRDDRGTERGRNKTESSEKNGQNPISLFYCISLNGHSMILISRNGAHSDK